MASIIGSERFDKHLVLSIKLDFDEMAELKGSIDNIHVIPEELAQTRSTVYERGKKKNSKYFLIPKSLRKGINLKKEVSCIKINSKYKIIYAYIIDKLKSKT